MKVTLYSTDCPKCKVLEAKLKDHNIQHNIVKDVKAIKDMGYMEAPILEVEADNNVMRYTFSDAVKFINNI